MKMCLVCGLVPPCNFEPFCELCVRTLHPPQELPVDVELAARPGALDAGRDRPVRRDLVVGGSQRPEIPTLRAA